MHIFTDVVRACKRGAFKISIVSLVGSLLLASIFLVHKAHASDYYSNFENIPAVNEFPLRAGRWHRTPTVIICEHAPVSKTQIKKAVRLWKDLGHRFLSTQYKYDPLNKCTAKEPVGYIVVHLITQGIKLEPDDLAETHFFVSAETSEINWAIIYMRSPVKEIVLEHEIGHALGYLHYNKINHLMNSKWIYGGWDVDGLKN